MTICRSVGPLPKPLSIARVSQAQGHMQGPDGHANPRTETNRARSGSRIRAQQRPDPELVVWLAKPKSLPLTATGKEPSRECPQPCDLYQSV